MVQSASTHTKRGLKRLVWTQMDALINSLRNFGIQNNDPLWDEALLYFANRINRQKNLSEVVRQKSPGFGLKNKVGWIHLFRVSEWPLIAFIHTQLTFDEESEIDRMEIPQLLDKVRKECPERESVIFPSGYYGMEVAEMSRRVKNQLRLDINELTELTQDGSKFGTKGKIVDYLIKIRPGLIKNT